MASGWSSDATCTRRIRTSARFVGVEEGVVVEDAAGGEALVVSDGSDGAPPFPHAPTHRIAVIARVDLKRFEGVTSGWYEPQCITVP